MQGSGKTTLAKMIGGLIPKASGRIFYYNHELHYKKPHQAIKHGIVYLGEDTSQNIILNENAVFNTTFSNPKLFSIAGFWRKQKMISKTTTMLRSLNVSNDVDVQKPLKYLSKGQQQKVALAKWLTANATLFILKNPTQFLDITSKTELYNIINVLSHKGKSFIIFSNDLSELSGMCDRVFILSEGQIIKEFEHDEASSYNILYHASQ